MHLINKSHQNVGRAKPCFRQRSLLLVAVPTLFLLLAFAGCTGGGPRIGDGRTVSLNQLWGMAAQETGAYPHEAILVEFEMTIAPASENSAASEQTARVDHLHVHAWAHGRSVDFNASWQATGPGEMSTEASRSRNDPAPPPVGYPLTALFSAIDYVGVSPLLGGLQAHAGQTTLRLRLVYPPPESPYGEGEDAPILVLRGRSIQVATASDLGVSPGEHPIVLKVLHPSTDTVLAILVVPDK